MAHTGDLLIYTKKTGLGFRSVDPKEELSQVTFDGKECHFFTMGRLFWPCVRPLWRKGGFMREALYFGSENYDKRSALIFVKSSNTEFTKEYITAYKQFQLEGKDLEMFGVTYIAHVGKTSFSLKVQLRNALTNQKLLSFNVLYVYVSLDTRKATALKPEFKALIPKDIPYEKMNVIEVMAPPENVNVVWIQEVVRRNYIDVNGHTNIGVYDILCLKAIAKGLSENLLTFLNQHHTDISYNDLLVKSRKLMFLNESKENDVLDIGAWQDNNSKSVFHVVVKKQDIKLVYMEIELHEVTKLRSVDNASNVLSRL